MSFSERNRPYETLIRHQPDGSISAHHRKIYEVLKDDVIISATVGDPTTVAGPELEQVLGQSAQQALVRVTQIDAENKEIKRQAKEDADAALEKLKAAEREIYSLKSQLTTLSAVARFVQAPEAQSDAIDGV